MAKLPAVSARETIRILMAFGFVEDRVRSSHHQMVKEGHSFVVTVPNHGHKDLRKGTLRQIIRAAGLTVEQFVEELNR